MDIAELTNLSVAGFTLLILFFIVKYFVQAMTSKDAYIAEITNAFNKTINNHLVHVTEQSKKETTALNKLSRGIADMTKELRILRSERTTKKENG